MSDTCISLYRHQIERLIRPVSFRGTRSATFKRLDGYFLCEVFFESASDLRPRMQIRSQADDLEIASAVCSAIQLATEWAVEEKARLEAGA